MSVCDFLIFLAVGGAPCFDSDGDDVVKHFKWAELLNISQCLESLTQSGNLSPIPLFLFIYFYFFQMNALGKFIVTLMRLTVLHPTL